MTKSARIQVITEIVGALAVVTTLIFLIVEIQQNTEQTALNARAVEVASYQDLISQITQMNVLAIENEDFVDLWIEFLENKELTRKEDMRVGSYLYMLFRHGDLAYYQYERGTITEERLYSTLRIITSRLEQQPRIREWWKLRKEAFSENYQSHLDQYILRGEEASGDGGTPSMNDW